MSPARLLSALIATACLAAVTEAFYIPGVAPAEYSKGDTLEIKVRHVGLCDRSGVFVWRVCVCVGCTAGAVLGGFLCRLCGPGCSLIGSIFQFYCLWGCVHVLYVPNSRRRLYRS